MFCNQCDKQLPENAIFCPSCGKQVVPVTRESQQPSAKAKVNPGAQNAESGKSPLCSVLPLPKDEQRNATPRHLRWIWSVVVGVLILVGVGGTLAIKGSGSPNSLGASGAHKDEKGVWTVDVKINNIFISLNLIPAGKFKMGSDIAESKDFVSHFPIHDVTLTRDFWMGKYVVTQNQWQAIMGNNPSIYQQQGPEAPVENISWDDCQIFISKLNSLQSIWTFRLPSEAEWEYACRANTVTETYAPIDQIAWSGENFFTDSPHPVGMKLPNNFGLYDMLGNVWQWCQDWAQIYSPNSQIDPKGPSTGDSKIRRGAASCISKEKMRASHRWDNPKDWKSEWDGFRLAADLRSKKEPEPKISDNSSPTSAPVAPNQKIIIADNLKNDAHNNTPIKKFKILGPKDIIQFDPSSTNIFAEETDIVPPGAFYIYIGFGKNSGYNEGISFYQVPKIFSSKNIELKFNQKNKIYFIGPYTDASVAVEMEEMVNKIAIDNGWIHFVKVVCLNSNQK